MSRRTKDLVDDLRQREGFLIGEGYELLFDGDYAGEGADAQEVVWTDDDDEGWEDDECEY